MNKENVREIVDTMRNGAYTLGSLAKFIGEPLDEQAQDELSAVDVCHRMRRDGLEFDAAFDAHVKSLDAIREELDQARADV